MGRSTVTTRVGQLDDIDVLTRLAAQGRAEMVASGVGEEADTASARAGGTGPRELAALLRNPAVRVVVAEVGGVVVGFAVLYIRRPASDQIPVIELGTMYVRPTDRRRGAGHALIADAAEFAAAVGAEQIACAPIPTTRAFHRFLVCLGFASSPANPTRRTALRSVLRRRLQASDQRVDEVVARRMREVRIRAACADVDARADWRTGEIPFVVTQPTRPRQVDDVAVESKSRHVIRALATDRPS